MDQLLQTMQQLESGSTEGVSMVARAGVQLATFALKVRFLLCKDMLPIAARCDK